MDGDPLQIGRDSIFPNQNSSMAPTRWESDLDQAAQQGIPCAAGPLLSLTQRVRGSQFLSGGQINPCPASVNPPPPQQPRCIEARTFQSDLGPAPGSTTSEVFVASGVA
jgi:hypothetical protein